jgi:hypothetical protein
LRGIEEGQPRVATVGVACARDRVSGQEVAPGEQPDRSRRVTGQRDDAQARRDVAVVRDRLEPQPVERPRQVGRGRPIVRGRALRIGELARVNDDLGVVKQVRIGRVPVQMRQRTWAAELADVS